MTARFPNHETANVIPTNGNYVASKMELEMDFWGIRYHDSPSNIQYGPTMCEVGARIQARRAVIGRWVWASIDGGPLSQVVDKDKKQYSEGLVKRDWPMRLTIYRKAD